MKKAILLTILAVCISLAAAWSQSRIIGKVTDAGNNPLANVRVVLLLKGIGIDSTHTLSDGRYIFNNVKAGSYKIQCAYLRQTETRSRIVTDGRSAMALNIKMQKVHALTANANAHMGPANKGRGTQAELAGDRSLGYAATPAGIDYRAYKAAPSGVLKQKSFAPHDYYQARPNTESYKLENENGYKSVVSSPLSTISVDVDRASYSNIRRFINQGQKPPVDAVRIEEMVNYFNYTYPQPKEKDPIAIVTELSECPWNKDHKLLHIGLQARSIDTRNLPASNLVFLLDVSGSMNDPNKLPLVKAALKLLTNNLRAKDKVSIVVYAGSAGLVLPPTSGDHKSTIIDALDRLEAGGSTAGGAGIQLAYKTAEQHFIKGGNNRIILATDGDFNVGVSNENELERMIAAERTKGIFLTCLGFGMGNYKDSKMEVLADKGNGNYAYIDNIQEAQKMLVSEFGGTLFTVAKDVKAQIEFNPTKVQGYRLIGYENRLLNTEDFKDDKKDAAEMGSGHSVTILYEIIPAGIHSDALKNDIPLKYQSQDLSENNSSELATLKFRYKDPNGAVSREIVHPISTRTMVLQQTSENFRFAASVAMFGMLLRDSPFKGNAGYERAIALAENARGNDREGYRAEFIRLVKSAR